MKKNIVLVSLLICIFILGCTRTNVNPTPGTGGDQQVVSLNDDHLPGLMNNGNAYNRPAWKEDIVSIEGVNYTYGFVLFEADPLGFTTYIPKDMSGETVSSGEGDVAIFKSEALYEGYRRDDLYLSISMLNPNRDLEEVVEEKKQILTNQGYQVIKRIDNRFRYYQWTIEEFDYNKTVDGDIYVGTVGFGSRGGRVALVVSHMPEEFVEGFSPLIDRILDDIRWYE